MQTAVVPFEVHRATKATALDKDSFRGMASVFDHLIDAFVPTRILPGAFTKTLKENRSRVKVLYQHNEDWPIGVPTKMEETRDGLLVEAKISQTERGKEALILIRDGVLDELSIGFDAVKWTMVNEPGLGAVRHITELRLWEFSPVTFAANAKAKITSVNRRGFRATFTQQMADLDAVAARLDAAMQASRPASYYEQQLALLDSRWPRR
jgi:HK97 family phage prohead protease